MFYVLWQHAQWLGLACCRRRCRGRFATLILAVLYALSSLLILLIRLSE